MRPADRDDTTRYLCAAAHLDDDFADEAIREFLVEPTRAVPPTPGVRAGAVLAEAVAARARRKVRDGVLLALFVLALFLFSGTALIIWVVVALGAASAGAVSKIRADSGALGTIVERADLMRRLVPMLVVLAVGGALSYAVVEYLGGSSSDFDDLSGYGQPDTDVAATVLSIFLLLALAAVLVVDELIVWHHLNNRFGRGRTVPEPKVSDLNWETRAVYAFGSRRFLDRLIALLGGGSAPALAGGTNGAEPPAAQVVVARGYKMFVGAGLPHEPWSFAVPLKPSSEDGEVRELSTGLLYSKVVEEMDRLRAATTLSPGGRFAGLTVTEQIVVAAEELIDVGFDSPAARDFLAGPAAAPYPMLRGHRVRELRDQPLEWARYYLCCQLETWDRDFVVSAFLHLAVDETTLYIEWTPCVLPPIRSGYRAIDSLSDSPLPAIGRALVGLVALPASVPGRVIRFCTTIKRPKRRRGTVSPDMYGVRYSLRELAAANAMHNYFQLADRERYLKVLESRLIPAISDVMREAGYEVATLEERAAVVSNNNTYINNSTVNNSGVLGGRGNRAAAASSASAAAKGPSR
jgi:hypothetical protein